MIKAIVLLLIIIPTLAFYINSKFRKYGFLKGLLNNNTNDLSKDILEIKKQYEKFSTKNLQQLLEKNNITLKEQLIIKQIINERISN